MGALTDPCSAAFLLLLAAGSGGREPAWWQVVPVLLLAVASAVYAVYRPTRGVADLAAGTGLVSR